MEFEFRFEDETRITGNAECVKVNISRNRLEIYPVNGSPRFYDLNGIKSAEVSTEPCHDWKKVY